MLKIYGILAFHRMDYVKVFDSRKFDGASKLIPKKSFLSQCKNRMRSVEPFFICAFITSMALPSRLNGCSSGNEPFLMVSQ